MYYYAFIDGDGICQAVYALPGAIESPIYIEITKEQYEAESILGLKWTGSEWITVEKYYYAVLIEKKFRKGVTEEDEVRYFVKEVIESAEKVENPLYVEIDALDDTKVGQLYDPDTAGLRNPEFKEIAFADTEQICVSGTNVVLTDKLATIEEAIESIEIPEVTAESIVEKLKTVDGASSGIDADLLDGKDSTYFATEEAFKALETKVDAVKKQVENIDFPEETATSILEKLKTIDGASSGIDADLLDGKDSTYFATVQGLQNLTTVVNGKAATNHTHSNYASAVTTTGSGNAITAISQSGNAITATKGASYALSDHEHAAKGCAIVSEEKFLTLESSRDTGGVELTTKITSEAGGWCVNNNKLIVPKAGKYLVMLSGEAWISSGSIGRIGLYTNIMNNTQGTSTSLGLAIIESKQFITGTSQRISTKGDYAIISVNKGDQISIQHRLTSFDGNVSCRVIMRPQIMLVEL